MKRSDSQIQSAYANIASKYDETRFTPSVEEFTTEVMLSLVDVREGVTVLDVAAGTGRTAVPLARTGATVVALDLTREMLAQTRAKADKLGLNNLYIEQANACQMPLRDDTFDVVVASRFLHLFDSQKQILIVREMHRVLKPGGTLLVEYSNQGAFWTGRFLKDILLHIWGRKFDGRVDRHQMQRLYQDYQIIRQQGISWPLIGAIARVFPSSVRPLLKLSMRRGFREFTRAVWVLSTKPGEVTTKSVGQV